MNWQDNKNTTKTNDMKTLTVTQQETKFRTKNLKDRGVVVNKVENGIYTTTFNGNEILVNNAIGYWEVEVNGKDQQEEYTSKVDAIWWTIRYL